MTQLNIDKQTIQKQHEEASKHHQELMFPHELVVEIKIAS